MKTQHKTIMCSIPFLLLSLLASFLFTMYCEYFIAKWYNLIHTVLTGAFTSILLILFSSLINYNSTRKSNAREIVLQLTILENEFCQLFPLLSGYKTIPVKDMIGSDLNPVIESKLLKITDILTMIIRAERTSPLSNKYIRKFWNIMSKTTKAEYEFMNPCANLLIASTALLDSLYQTQNFNNAERARSNEKVDSKDSIDINEKLEEQKLKHDNDLKQTRSILNGIHHLDESYEELEKFKQKYNKSLYKLLDISDEESAVDRTAMKREWNSKKSKRRT